MFCIVVCATNSIGQAQEERYELGQRLRRFELAWQMADREGRIRCVDPMQKAVQNFFSLRLSTAARELDQAYFAVRSTEAPDDFERYAISRRLSIGPALIDAGRKTIDLKLQPFYKVDQPPPANATVRVEFRGVGGSHPAGHDAADGATIVAEDFDLDALVNGATCNVSQLSDGDFEIMATATSGVQTVPFAKSVLSKIKDVSSRLDDLEVLLKRRDTDNLSVIQSTDLATCKQLLRTLRSQLNGQVQEVDYPSLQLLTTCEALLNGEVDSAAYFSKHAKQNDIWMTLSDVKKQVSVRLRCPAETTKPMPVLFAFHGAGGSENMFFETYGAGRLVELATQRGWMVVAPRQGLLGLNLNCRAMLDVLSKYYDIDSKRVFLLGHSMGAAQVMRQVAIDPDLPSAAVAIGGGGRMVEAEKYVGFPWFVVAGEFDFGRSGAKTLAGSLKQKSVDVRYSEYPNVEHMVIVQAALDDVFKFLDETQANK